MPPNGRSRSSAERPGLEKRLRDRLVRTAAVLADRPSGSLPERFAWAELKAAYRLVDRAAANPDGIQAVHRARTAGRCGPWPGRP